MDDLTTRGYEAGDATALTDLFNTIEEFGGGHPGYVPDDMTSFVAALIHDTGSDSRLVFTPAGTLVAAALTATPPNGGHRVDVWGGVLPAWRGRGLGRDLLGWQLTRAAEIHRAVSPEATWEAHAGASLDDEAALRLFARLGMTPVRYWFEMVAPTAQVPDLPVPDGLRVDLYAPEHEKAVYAAHVEAFSDHWGYQRRELDEWSPLTVRSETFLADLSMVAFDGDELAGYVLSYKDAEPTRLYIGHVGVRRAWRRRGLAGALLARVLAEASRKGHTSAGLGVDADSPTGAVGVYERVGFTIESRSVTYSSELMPSAA